MQRFSREKLLNGRMRKEDAYTRGLKQRYIVIVNPVSRGGKALEEYMWLLKRLRRLKVSHEDFFTEKSGHAEEIIERCIKDVDVVVAVGGDGTINEAVNAVMANGDPEKTLAVFPAGTADDFCHNLGIPRGRKEALRTLLTDNSREIDLIRYDSRYAAVSLGIGVDAEIAYSALMHKRARIPAYFYVGLRIAFVERMRKSPKQIKITGGNGTLEGKFLIAIFGNAPLFGRFVYLMPDAIMDDGIMNLTTIRPMKPVPAFTLFLRSFKKGYHSKSARYEGSDHYTVELFEDSFMQVDGEVYRLEQGEKLDLSVARNAIKVRVPVEPEEAGPFNGN